MIETWLWHAFWTMIEIWFEYEEHDLDMIQTWLKLYFSIIKNDMNMIKTDFDIIPSRIDHDSKMVKQKSRRVLKHD